MHIDRYTRINHLLKAGLVGIVGVCTVAGLLHAADTIFVTGMIGSGSHSSGGDYTLHMMVAEPVAGEMTSGELSLCIGYQCVTISDSPQSTATSEPTPTASSGEPTTPTPDPGETVIATPTASNPGETTNPTPTPTTDPSAPATPQATGTPGEPGTETGQTIYLPVITR